MFSLCIPTLDRYDNFLSKNLIKYLENKNISEIIICDENGNDVNKIIKNFNSKKLKLFINENKLGAFKNKLKCLSLASNEWIALIDSDNFANNDYFDTAIDYINNLKKSVNKNKIMLYPSFAKPNFNISAISDKILHFRNNKHFSKNDIHNLTILSNLGNYIINKKLINNINLSIESEYNQDCGPYDGVYLNCLLFEQKNAEIHIVKNMHYEHIHHDSNTYNLTSHNYINYYKYIYTRYFNLINISTDENKII